MCACVCFPGATGADEIDVLAANGSSPRHMSGEKPRAAGQWLQACRRVNWFSGLLGRRG